MKNKSPFLCPACGEPQPPNARACRGCGSDETTGWSENTYLDGIDLPFDEDEYEEAKAKEFGGGSKGIGIRIDWRMAIGAAVAAAMLLTFVFRR